MKETINMFKFSTKALPQDEFLCWSINCINEDIEHPLYQYGKEMLDLFLDNDKQEKYYDVQVYRQYEKINILVIFKDFQGNSHALIIESKTSTSEHETRMCKYKKKLAKKLPSDDKLKVYENPEIHLAYLKTGIIYDEEVRMLGNSATIVDLDKLFEVVSKYAKKGV